MSGKGRAFDLYTPEVSVPAPGSSPEASRATPSFGLFLPQIGLSFSQIVDAARDAESLGFAHVWFVDHFEVPGSPGVLEAWTVATAVACGTRSIRVGHLVLCAGFRHPALLGKMAATLDQVSDGRLNLGLGWGSSPGELRTYGVSTDSGEIRRAKLAETITIVRAMLAGGTVTFTGRHYAISEASCFPSAVQSHLPVVIGGASRATMELVRTHGDWWNCPSAARHKLAQLVPTSGPARVSANYSVLLVETARTEVDVLGDESAPVFSASPEALAELLVVDRALGVELFNLQFVNTRDLRSQMRTFMTRVAPAVA